MREYTVGDCFYQIRNGANIKQGYGAGGYPITRIETTANDTFNRDRMGFAGITDLSKYEGYVLEDGDLLMSHINSVQYLGRTVLYEKQENETIIHGMNLLSLKANRNIILPEFARYSFRSDPFKKQLSKITKKSVNQASFTVADLKKISLSVPPLNEQKSIVQTLDKCRLIEAKRQQQLSALDDLIKARFVEMFGDLRSNPKGWPVYCFEDITEIITDGEHATPRRVDQGIYLLSARNVLDHGLQLYDVDFIDQEEYDRIAKRIIPQAGDVLISCSGSVGRCCTVPEGLKFQMVRSAALLRFDKRVLPVYAEYMITSDDLQDQINSSKTASSQANLFQGRIAKLKGFVPPIAQQEQFASFVAQIAKSKSVIQKSLDETQLLFNSLMQKYFG